MVENGMTNIASLYGYCLRRVAKIWTDIGEQHRPSDLQSGVATVFRHAVKVVPVSFLQGDASVVTDEVKARVDHIVELYKQALQMSMEHWKKHGRYDMDAVQAGAATILIQALQANNPFAVEEDEVRVQEEKHERRPTPGGK